MRANLIVGRFYWVVPAFDPDTDAEWESEMQPARYAGKDAAGNLLWNCLGIDGASDWHMRWIGTEICMPVAPVIDGVEADLGPYRLGYKAAEEQYTGKAGPTQCPYPRGSEEAEEWHAGNDAFYRGLETSD